MKAVRIVLGPCLSLSLLLYVLLSGLSCVQQVANPADCTNDESTCTQRGLVCDPRLHQCVALDGCVSSAMCSSPSASSCVDNQCSACASDSECTEWSRLRNATPQRTFCISINQQPTCTQCRPGTGSADCPDPMNPICDDNLGLCRPCRTDRECPSRLCRKLGDYPEVSPVSGLQNGQCIPREHISYVDQDSSRCQMTGDTSTPEQPFCRLSLAMAQNRPYISLAPSGEFYPSISMNAPGKTITIIGPHQDTRSFAYMDRITVTAGTLIMQNMYLASLSASPQISCVGSQSSLFLIGSTLLNISKRASRPIDTTMGCGQLTLDRMLISCQNEPTYGIVIGGGIGTPMTNYRIINTAVLSCGGTTDPYAIQFNESARGYFGFNTVNGNNKGVLCKSPEQVIVNSLVNENRLAQIDGCTFDPRYNILDRSMVDMPSPPFVQRISEKNDRALVDKALAPPADQKVLVDFDGNPRPQGAGYDIGIQELK